MNKLIPNKLHTLLLAITVSIFSMGSVVAKPKNGIRTVQHVEDFAALLEQAIKERKVIMLEMSATYCNYCRILEEEIINPMIISGDYNHVIIRQMHIDSYYDLIMPNNKKMTPSEYARSKNVFVTPTLLFLNGNNEEVAERIIGVNSLDYFGAYVDEALNIGAENL